MNYRAIMLHDINNNTWISEMAAAELRQVVKFIKAEQPQKAAEEYIKLGGNTRGITKTVNSYLTKNPNEDPAPFQKFRAAVSKMGAIIAPTGKREYKKKIVTGVTKKGEKIVAAQGQKQSEVKKKGLKTIRKSGEKIKEEMEVLEGKDVEKQKQVARDILSTWEISSLSKKRPAEKEQVASLLWSFINKNLNRKEAISVMKKIVKEGASATEALAQMSISKKPLFSPTEKRKKEIDAIHKEIGIKKGKKLGENILYEQMLIDSYNYKGSYFWENYILSNIVRTFPEYMLEYGKEDAVEMFVSVYGEDAKPLFEYMIDNEELLIETALVAGKGLLFEEIGEENMVRYLAEADGILGALKSTATNFGSLLNKQRKNLGQRIAQGASGSKVVGFLKGLWNKFKEIGATAFKRVMPFLKSGFAWAKNLVTKGIGWIAVNPIARVAIPALLIGGGVFGAIKLINKLRRKSGKKAMDKQEIETIKNLEQKNKDKLEKYRQKAKVA